MFDVPESEINHVCINDEVVKGERTAIYRTLEKNIEDDNVAAVEDDADSYKKDATSSA